MKRVKDERIMKITDKMTAVMYPVILCLTVIGVGIKLYWKMPIEMYLLEALAVLVSLGYYVIANLIKGTLIMKPLDDRIKETKAHIGMICFMICLWFYVFGEFLLMMLYLYNPLEAYLNDGFMVMWTYPEAFLSIVLYIPIWLIPASILSVQSVKKGLLIPGTKKVKKTTMINFKVRVVIGSLFFGVFMSIPYLWRDGSINPYGILWILGQGAGWGIPFYFVMKIMMSKSEKKADKELEEAERLGCDTIEE